MAIQILGSAQKIRVGRESGNTTFFFFRLYKCIYKNLKKNINKELSHNFFFSSNNHLVFLNHISINYDLIK